MKPGKIYHIYNHGNADDNLFRCDENYRYFLQKYGEHVHPVVDTYAYCLMPNHFHFLLKVKEDSLTNLMGFENLSGLKLEQKIVQQFSNFFNAYTKAFNKMYERKGKLFLTPFKRKPITNSWHFLNTWKYIHYNAVRHQFTKDPYEWPFSSIHDYRLKKSDFISLLYPDLSGFENLSGLKMESDLQFLGAKGLMPDWNDFLEFDY